MLKKQWLLFPVLFIEGASLMAVELTSARLVAPFYGNSLYVWTAVLCFSVLGLSAGYYSGGILSRKYPTEKALFTILLIAALLVFLLPVTSRVIIHLTAGTGIIAGVCLTDLVLLVPPMLCFGMVGPMMVRIMTTSMDRLGKVSGTVYFISTSGSILSAFLFGLYLIPLAGIKISILIAAISLAIIPLLSIPLLISGKLKFPVSVNSTAEINLISGLPGKIKKKQTPGPIAATYIFAVIEGATVMALELTAARMLAPWYGSSLHTWAIIIGITLTGLALGYYIGGRIPVRFKGMNIILFIILTASVLIMTMQVAASNLPLLFNGINPVISLLITSILLILPVITLLGTVPTLLIRQLTTRAGYAGTITGRVFTVSSLSGILAVPLFGFWLIPEFGLTVPLIITGILIGLYPFLILVINKKISGWTFISLTFLSLILAPKWKDTNDIKIRYQSEGLLGQVIVADFNIGQTDAGGKSLNGRMLFVNRMGQSQQDLNSGASKWNYTIFTSAAGSILPENSTALVLGSGGGSISNTLRKDLNFTVDAVELDPRIASVSKQFFNLDRQVNMIIDDARHYLETTVKKYDLIVFDLFRGEIQPAHVFSLEAFRKAGSLLKENGFLIVNFNGFLTGEPGKSGRSVIATLKTAGFRVKILPTPGTEKERNLLILASEVPLSFNQMRTPLAHNGQEVPLYSLFLDDSDLNLSDAIILTDDKPVLEWLNISATGSWRQDYNSTYTRLMVSKGIPLFK